MTIKFKEFFNLEEKNEVKNYKIKGVNVSIIKQDDEFVVYMDGDKFDTFKSQKEAEKGVQSFVKMVKG